MFHRAASLNDEPLLSTAQAELVADHLKYECDCVVLLKHALLACGCCVGPVVDTDVKPCAPRVRRHGEVSSNQYKLNCPDCTNPMCRTIVNPVAPYTKLRDTYDAPSSIPTWKP